MHRTRALALLAAPILAFAGLLAAFLLRHDATRQPAARPDRAPATALRAPEPQAALAGPARVAQAPTGELAPLPEEEAVVVDEDPEDADAEIDFLPYPNKGEEAFAEKYGPLSAAEIYYAQHVLNEKLSMLADVEAKARFDSGQYFSRAPVRADQLRGDESEDWWWPNKPVGQGRVWPCSQGVPAELGRPELRCTYLTESEYPELFAKLDEWLYVSHLFHQKDKAKKH